MYMTPLETTCNIYLQYCAIESQWVGMRDQRLFSVYGIVGLNIQYLPAILHHYIPVGWHARSELSFWRCRQLCSRRRQR